MKRVISMLLLLILPLFAMAQAETMGVTTIPMEQFVRYPEGQPVACIGVTGASMEAALAKAKAGDLLTAEWVGGDVLLRMRYLDMKRAWDAGVNVALHLQGATNGYDQYLVLPNLSCARYDALEEEGYAVRIGVTVRGATDAERASFCTELENSSVTPMENAAIVKLEPFAFFYDPNKVEGTDAWPEESDVLTAMNGQITLYSLWGDPEMGHLRLFQMDDTGKVRSADSLRIVDELGTAVASAHRFSGSVLITFGTLGECPFTDIAGHPYENDIRTAWDNGELMGFAKESAFMPDLAVSMADMANHMMHSDSLLPLSEPITRAELVHMLVQADGAYVEANAEIVSERDVVVKQQ